MAKKLTPVENPTLVGTELKLGKETFHLYFDFASMAKAERLLREQGVQINLLKQLMLDEFDAGGLSAVFYTTLQKNHPEITYDKVLGMMNKVRNVMLIQNAVLTAYMASQADEDEESPNE